MYSSNPSWRVGHQYGRGAPTVLFWRVIEWNKMWQLANHIPNFMLERCFPTFLANIFLEIVWRICELISQCCSCVFVFKIFPSILNLTPHLLDAMKRVEHIWKVAWNESVLNTVFQNIAWRGAREPLTLYLWKAGSRSILQHLLLSSKPFQKTI